MTAAELRQTFLDFFRARGHAVLPSASLIPENDPTVLFTTAGMHPLVPFLLGEKHPAGTRLTNSQKCIRTQDIEDVGDRRHTTFFEMLGIWSLGDYFKADVIPWTFEFFTRELGFAPERLYVSVFQGDDAAPQDAESIGIWQRLFADAGLTATLAPATNPNVAAGHRIFQYGKAKNWWGPAGQTGPCGPDTEIFYDTGREHDPAFGEYCHPNCDCGRFIEIGNDVFMEFNKTADGQFEPLAQKNVDVGWGLERLTAMTQGVPSVFEIELFAPIIRWLETQSGQKYLADPATAPSFEVVADHLRAATFILGDPVGVVPSNVGQGYVLRRLIRRAIRHAAKLGIPSTTSITGAVAELVIQSLGDVYPELVAHRQRIMTELAAEEAKFSKTLEKGLREFTKLASHGSLTGADAFMLFSTYGFPIELTEELGRERGFAVNHDEFQAEFTKHQELSRTASAGMFKGGLADHGEQALKYHTATHLLHAALRQVLGTHVEQRGSNITAERLRFDFSHPDKLTDEEKKKVEDLVNAATARDYPVSFEEMSVDEAKKRGAMGLFGDKYGERVKVYSIGDPLAPAVADPTSPTFSREICGGPHVEHTGVLGTFKITKEEASSAGIRRIKAVLG